MNALAADAELTKQADNAARDLDSLTEDLKDICRIATLDLAFRVGELVIKNLFGGDPSLWESEGVKRKSYRALASRGDLPLSASALCRSVGVYVLVNQVGGRERWRHLSASHFQEVLPVAAEKRVLLLENADAERWSVARLRDEIRQLKELTERHSATVVRGLRRIGFSLTKHKKALERMGDAELDATSRQNLGQALRAIRVALAEIEKLASDEAEVRAQRPRSDITELRPRKP